jgi:hypothetical protein
LLSWVRPQEGGLPCLYLCLSLQKRFASSQGFLRFCFRCSLFFFFLSFFSFLLGDYVIDRRLSEPSQQRLFQ